MAQNGNQLLDTIFALNRVINQQMTIRTDLTNLTILQIHAMAFLEKNKNAQMSDIAAFFRIELPSATSLINKLCQMGLVERSEDKKDRRLVRIGVTIKGVKLFDKVKKQKTKTMKKILSYLTQKDREELQKILQKLVVSIDKVYEK